MVGVVLGVTKEMASTGNSGWLPDYRYMERPRGPVTLRWSVDAFWVEGGLLDPGENGNRYIAVTAV